jgi:hypothetical protein
MFLFFLFLVLSEYKQTYFLSFKIFVCYHCYMQNSEDGVVSAIY